MTTYVAKDYDAAVALFTKAAGKGSAKAKYMLGVCCYDGSGVEKDWDAAYRWFYEAAKQGDPRAQHDLAGLYRDGLGVTKDPAEADKWFALAAKNYRAAAEQGDPDAQAFLNSHGE